MPNSEMIGILEGVSTLFVLLELQVSWVFLIWKEGIISEKAAVKHCVFS